MKLKLPSRLVHALLTTCAAALTTNAPVFADVPSDYTPVIITDGIQLADYTESDYIAFIISSYITDSAYRLSGAHQYWTDGAMNVHDLTFEGIESISNGGALSVGSELVVEHLRELSFLYNAPTARGGAIYGDSSSAIALSCNESVMFGDNTASEGGAIYGVESSVITFSNNGSVEFSGNSAAKFGGAIYGDESSVITFSNNGSVEFWGNFSVGELSYGGAIYGNSTCITTINGNGSVTFSYNTASEGGAICSKSDSYDSTNITFNDNDSVMFRGNSATLEGGAIYVRGTLDLTENETVTFSYNTASSNGGAIYGDCNFSNTITLSGNESMTFSCNSAAKSGGAIYGGKLNLTNNTSVTFSGNSAAQSSDYFDGGGAIYARGTLNLSENGCVMFSGNSAVGPLSGGGAIYSASTFTLSGNESVTFRENSARTGGAIYADRTFNLTGNTSATFSENTASGSGGAIYALGTLNLTKHGNVTFYANSARTGGAIAASYDSDITFNDNESVEFSGNTASGSGGAISGDRNSDESSVITFNENGSVSFSENSATTGGAIYALGTLNLTENTSATFSENTASGSGGAIYASGTLNLTKHGNVTFYANSAETGGAIAASYHSDITFNDNESVEFSGNTASGSGGAISGGRYSDESSVITFNENGSVSFSENSATSGGAIYALGTLNLTGNTSVTFSQNTASGSGGAIYALGTLNLAGNGRIVFQGNYEQSGSGDSATYRLRSMYGTESILNMSAGANQDIVFYDTLYANTTSTVSFNAKYVDKDGVEQEATGDIVFSGKYAEEDLMRLKPNYTQQELMNSLTTEVLTTTNLYGGRLSIEDGAIYKGYGINVADGGHAALRLANGELNHVKNYSNKYDVTLASDTTLDLQGVNKISAGSLDMQDGSILSFTLGETNLTMSALTLDGIFNQGGNLSISIQGDETYDPADTYMLITMASSGKPETWDIDKISLNESDTNVNHLWWENGVLYYRELPPLVTATWSGAQSRAWNFTDKNWTQDGDQYRYEDGVDVVFGGMGCGEVVLADEVTPLSVLVENSAGHDYTITGEGSLAGATALTKEGAGKLTIATANTYEGGTVINGGTVALGSDTALGTGDIQLNDGMLDLGGNTIANNITTPEGAIVTIGNGTTTGNLSIAYTELSITGNVQVDGQIQASLENMIIVDDGATLGISQAIANTGTYLEISGSIDISKMHGEVIGTSLTGGEDPANGFLGTTERVQVIDNVSGGDVYIDYANFYHLGIETQVDDNFMAEVVCSADYTVFYLNENTEKLSTALNGAAAAQVELVSVEMKSGTQLDVDSNASADLIHVESGTVTMNIAEGVTLAETDSTRTDFVLQGKGRYSLMNGSTTLGATMGDGWQGIVQINGATFSAFDLNDYGTANSTVSLNDVSAKLMDGTTFSPNLELLGDGLTITDFSSSGLTYVFAGNVSGDGNMTFNPSGMRHRTTFVFTGDVSQWTGTYENMVANRNSTLQFYGNATEMGAAIKQTAGAVSVIVGNGTDEHTTTFTNTVEAGSLTVQEHATAILGGDTTITNSLILHGQLETKGGSLALGANATMQIGSAMGMKANKEGDINVSDNTVIEATSMHGKNGMGMLNNVDVDIIEDYTIENMSISGSVIDISEGKHLYVKHVNIAADARITDEAAWLDMVDTHGWLDNTNTVAEEPVMSLGDTLFYRSGDDAWMRLNHDVSYVALTSELFSNVIMTGSDLWLDLTGLADTIGSARAFSIAFKDALYDVNGLRVVATVDGEHYFDGYYTTKQDGTTTTLYFSSQIPEPTTGTLSLLALAALAARRRRTL